jgi:hypothetical protein
VAKAIKQLLYKCEALSSNPSPGKNELKIKIIAWQFSAFGKLRQEDLELKVSLDFIVASKPA